MQIILVKEKDPVAPETKEKIIDKVCKIKSHQLLLHYIRMRDKHGNLQAVGMRRVHYNRVHAQTTYSIPTE